MSAGDEETTEPDGEPRSGGFGRLAIVALVTLLVVGGVVALAAGRPRGSETRTISGGGTTSVVVDPEPDRPDEPAASTSTSTTLPPGPTSITLAFAGDLLPHGPVNRQAQRYGAESGAAYDFAPMLAPMAGVVGAADLGICHMEVVVAPPGEEVSSYPSFGAPAELVDAAEAAGYDGCSNASNHSLDRGRAGIAATLDRFDQDGLEHAGIARTEEESQAITTYDVQGVQVAHLSYAYGFNGYRIPDDAPWAVNQIDPARIEADAARARTGGADLVVVSLHWGTEYDSDPSAYQRDIAGQLLPSPNIDVIIGHHAHVVQPIEQVEGTYVVWGLGNQLSNMEQGPRRDGLTAVLTATRDGERWKVSGIEAVPTYVDLSTFRVLPVVATLADPNTPGGLRDELSASYDRTVGIVTGPGTPGVTVAPRP